MRSFEASTLNTRKLHACILYIIIRGNTRPLGLSSDCVLFSVEPSLHAHKHYSLIQTHMKIRYINCNKYSTSESRRKLSDKINMGLKQSEKEGLNRIYLEHAPVDGPS